MATEQQIAANRRNAKWSSGPKTRAGRARSSRNALRHGLSISATRDPALVGEIELLAHSLKNVSDATRFSQAVVAAQGEVDLRRVRQQRAKLLTTKIGVSPNWAEIEKLERYERRAHTRFRRGLKGLDEEFNHR